MKIGIIGAGKIAERHISGYKRLGFEIAITDSNSCVAERIARNYSINFVKNSEEILHSPSFEVIDVCTPVNTHKDIILKALKRNKHVFCEKPLCLNLNEAYQIKGAAENAEKLKAGGVE